MWFNQGLSYRSTCLDNDIGILVKDILVSTRRADALFNSMIPELLKGNSQFQALANEMIRAASNASQARGKKSWLGKDKWPEAHDSFIRLVGQYLNAAYAHGAFGEVTSATASFEKTIRDFGEYALAPLFHPSASSGDAHPTLRDAREYYAWCLTQEKSVFSMGLILRTMRTTA